MSKPPIDLPNLCKLMDDKHIKLYLDGCKVIVTLSGKRMVVSKIFQQAFYGSFRGPQFFPSAACTSGIISQLLLIERDGLKAVNEIGLLTGNCCICGRTLVNEESISGGIGPICAGKVGWGQENVEF